MSVKVWQEGQAKETEEEKKARLAQNEQYLSMPYGAKVNLARNRIWEWYDACMKNGKHCAVSVGGLDSITLLALCRDELGHWPEIRALLNKYCGYTLAEDEVLLLEIGGALWYISDITMRMLAPKELYAAMGFPPDYIIDQDYTGKAYPKTQQVARCGNAVCPPMARAVVAANMPEYYVVGINTMAELERRCAV